MSTNYVTLEGTVGDDSRSGLAFKFTTDDTSHWVPYSARRARHVNTKVKGQDKIEVEKWWAEKNEIEQ